MIDFSIEAITGIGAGIAVSSCSHGITYTSGSCVAGDHASLDCGLMGFSPSTACLDGHVPYRNGTDCNDGDTAQVCVAGSGASGFRAECKTGSSPTYLCFAGSLASGNCSTGSNFSGSACTDGASPSSCINGNSDVPTPHS